MYSVSSNMWVFDALSTTVDEGDPGNMQFSKMGFLENLSFSLENRYSAAFTGCENFIEFISRCDCSSFLIVVLS